MKTISVIVPIYNVEKYLERCINSIINQTYKELEIILIDDASSDDSWKICEQMARKDVRIKIYRNEENLGTFKTRNIGIQKSTGNLIGFVDSDDTIDVDMFEILVNNLEKYDVIIFDTSPENFMDYTKELIFLSNKIIFISGANLLEVKKSEKLLEIYTKEWGVSKNKINIVFNRCTNKSIDTDILREIFNRYTILGKIQLNDYYDLIINKNMSQKSKIRKEIENIKKKIIKEKYYGIS